MSTDSMPEVPVVVCASDDRYAMPLAVMLRSMAENSVKYSAFSVWILDGGIRAENKRKILETLDCCNFDIHWVRPSHRQLNKVPVFGHVSICTYYRLLIPDLLPLSVSKVIYLDVDAIVCDDIGNLWDIDMAGHALLASPVGNDVVSSPNRLSVYAELGMAPDIPYFAAGTLVLDLEKWRKDNIGARAIEFLSKYSGRIRWHDQDALNAIMMGKYGHLDQSWCYLMFAQTGGDNELAGDLLRGHGQDRGRIIQFAGSVKPWHYGVVHPGRALFFHYLSMTTWAGWRPRKPRFSLAVRRLKATLFNRYLYGKYLRRIPVFGRWWALWREAKHHAKQDSTAQDWQ